AYFYYSNQQNQYFQEQRKRVEDSLAKLKPVIPVKKDTTQVIANNGVDSLTPIAAEGVLSTANIGKEKFTTIENNLFKATFSNKGGIVYAVELKNYKTPNGKKVVLGANKDNALGYVVNTSATQAMPTDKLFFAEPTITMQPDSSQLITYTLQSPEGKQIIHTYTVYKDNYAIDWKIGLKGIATLVNNQTLNFSWKWQTEQVEPSNIYERQMSNICFSEDGSFDYISSNTDHTFESKGQWIGVVQQFFNTTVIAKNAFESGAKISWQRATDDSSTLLAKSDINFQVKLNNTNEAEVPMQLFFGPNEYQILKTQAAGMDKIVNLGRDIYSFVRPINMYIIMPVFNFLGNIIHNMGWAIMLLTIFIRVITSPLMYSSYVSGAKMKVLKPEMDGLKKKFGDDQQGFAMEQMKLFREAGVNPAAGCIPALLQIPIFFALYSFFNSNIDLRGVPFLWSDDLSSYDVIAKLPFSIPLNFGDHISLFTITAVITSFAISIYNMGNTPTQDNPAIKYMPYIFPFLMLFFFNRLPSALTWYYTVSNTITLILQFVIQKYIIDHDKIMAKIQATRANPKKKTKSKWQERYEQVLESQRKVQEMKKKVNK
ncbi:MAG: membrane protein insertase YidC, partial [Chitinophagaceae bacterium]